LWGGVDELSEYLWFGWRQLAWVGAPTPGRRFGRPQHRESRGFVAGEAAAMVVVEPETAARARDVPSRAVIEYAAAGSVEAKPWAYPEADQVEAACGFFEQAVAASGPPDVVVACANGHPRLDAFEAAVLGHIVGERAAVWCPKGQVGETMASTALRAALAVWLIEEGFVPGNFWLQATEGPVGLTLPRETVSQRIERVLIPTISAGGTLGALVMAAPNPAIGAA
jgi:3-oxoacyl-(acyl-carrier-protein) synthase